MTDAPDCPRCGSGPCHYPNGCTGVMPEIWRSAADDAPPRIIAHRDLGPGYTHHDGDCPCAVSPAARPHTWPGPVLPPSDAAGHEWCVGRPFPICAEGAPSCPAAPPSDAGLCGLARRDATAHDWRGWHGYRQRVQGGDDDAGAPWGAETDC